MGVFYAWRPFDLCAFIFKTPVWLLPLDVFFPFQFLIVETIVIIIGPGHAKMCLMSYANSLMLPRSLISIFIVRCLGSMICIPAIAKV